MQNSNGQNNFINYTNATPSTVPGVPSPPGPPTIPSISSLPILPNVTIPSLPNLPPLPGFSGMPVFPNFPNVPLPGMPVLPNPGNRNLFQNNSANSSHTMGINGSCVNNKPMGESEGNEHNEVEAKDKFTNNTLRTPNEIDQTENKETENIENKNESNLKKEEEEESSKKNDKEENGMKSKITNEVEKKHKENGNMNYPYSNYTNYNNVNNSNSSSTNTHGWCELVAKNGRKYYYNTITNVSKWEKPDELKTEEEIKISQMTNWREYLCADGRKYWYNVEKKVSVWEEPEEIRKLKLELAKEKEKEKGNTNEKETKEEKVPDDNNNESSGKTDNIIREKDKEENIKHAENNKDQSKVEINNTGNNEVNQTAPPVGAGIDPNYNVNHMGKFNNMMNMNLNMNMNNYGYYQNFKNNNRMPYNNPMNPMIYGGMNYNSMYYGNMQNPMMNPNIMNPNIINPNISMPNAKKTKLGGTTEAGEVLKDKNKAKEQLKKLLEEKDISPKTNWEGALKILETEPDWSKYNILTKGEKKQLYSEYVSNSIKRANEKERRKKQKTKELIFQSLVSWKNLNEETTYKQFAKKFHNEEWWNWISENERNEVFQDFIEDYKQEFKETRKKKKKKTIENLTEKFKQYAKSGETLKWELIKEVFKKDEDFKMLHPLDALATWESFFEKYHINEKEVLQKKLYRILRKRREAFIELLQEQCDKNQIHLKTDWSFIVSKICDDPRYSELLGREGSTPKELFEEFVEKLQKEYLKHKTYIKKAFKKNNFSIKEETTLDEFLQMFSSFQEKYNISKTNMTFIYQSIQNKLKEKKKREQKHIYKVANFLLKNSELTEELSFEEVIGIIKNSSQWNNVCILCPKDSQKIAAYNIWKENIQKKRIDHIEDTIEEMDDSSKLELEVEQDKSSSDKEKEDEEEDNDDDDEEEDEEDDEDGEEDGVNKEEGDMGDKEENNKRDMQKKEKSQKKNKQKEVRKKRKYNDSTLHSDKKPSKRSKHKSKRSEDELSSNDEYKIINEKKEEESKEKKNNKYKKNRERTESHSVNSKIQNESEKEYKTNDKKSGQKRNYNKKEYKRDKSHSKIRKRNSCSQNKNLSDHDIESSNSSPTIESLRTITNTPL